MIVVIEADDDVVAVCWEDEADEGNEEVEATERAGGDEMISMEGPTAAFRDVTVCIGVGEATAAAGLALGSPH